MVNSWLHSYRQQPLLADKTLQICGYCPCLLWSLCLKNYLKRRKWGKRLKKKLLESMNCLLVVQDLDSDPFQPDTFSQGASRHVLWVQNHRDTAHVKSRRPSSAVWHTDSINSYFPPWLVSGAQTSGLKCSQVAKKATYKPSFPALLKATNSSTASLLLHLLSVVLDWNK